MTTTPTPAPTRPTTVSRIPHPLEDIAVTVHRDRIYLAVRNTETRPMRRPDIAALIDRLCEAVKEGRPVMQSYVLALDCETCGEQMRIRVGDLTTEPGDELVIDLGLAVSQTEFTCHNCGGISYLSDLEEIVMHELGDSDGLAGKEDDDDD